MKSSPCRGCPNESFSKECIANCKIIQDIQRISHQIADNGTRADSFGPVPHHISRFNSLSSY